MTIEKLWVLVKEWEGKALDSIAFEAMKRGTTAKYDEPNPPAGARTAPQ
jgi:hypothetical protein